MHDFQTIFQLTNKNFCAILILGTVYFAASRTQLDTARHRPNAAAAAATTG
ncbi:MAG: hypothetical protein ABI690_34435 [Chloroflexota bacterium]